MIRRAEHVPPHEVTAALSSAAVPLTSAAAWDPLLDRIGDASLVLLGEATHGTHEFYALRAQLTQRLIVEKGFNCVAVEADWPDAYRANRWVRGAGHDPDARAALGDFRRFPLWMWRNAEVVSFLEALRALNDARDVAERVGFYGLDVYGLYASIDHVVEYLERIDPQAAARARRRYACLANAGDEPQQYGWSVSLRLQRACRDEAVQQLIDLRRKAEDYLRRDGLVAADELFFAEQSARAIVNAEEYYREMFGRRANTWNLRDRHMTETLGALMEHLSKTGAPPASGARGRAAEDDVRGARQRDVRGEVPSDARASGAHPRRPAKVVVWEHNSHIGDARATEQHDQGELNVGELVRQRWGDAAVLVGFTTYSGTVTAASDWGGPVERKRVRPGLHGSVEALFHELGPARFLLPLWDERVQEALDEQRLERAIGVIYRPESERLSHYLRCHVPSQFDAIVHVDETRAVEPLDRTSAWDQGEPETYPSGL